MKTEMRFSFVLMAEIDFVGRELGQI